MPGENQWDASRSRLAWDSRGCRLGLYNGYGASWGKDPLNKCFKFPSGGKGGGACTSFLSGCGAIGEWEVEA